MYRNNNNTYIIINKNWKQSQELVKYAKGNLNDRFVRTNMRALDMVISRGDKSDHG